MTGGSTPGVEPDETPVVDELTGLANRRGFVEILRLEERRRARYGGSLTLLLVDVGPFLTPVPQEERDALLLSIAATLAEATRDTDTLARVDDCRFGLLAIQAGSTPTPIVGRLRLFLAMRGVSAEVTVAPPGPLEQTWRDLVQIGVGSRRYSAYPARP
jgi:GGDEF domain-containing protein